MLARLRGIQLHSDAVAFGRHDLGRRSIAFIRISPVAVGMSGMLDRRNAGQIAAVGCRDFGDLSSMRIGIGQSVAAWVNSFSGLLLSAIQGTCQRRRGDHNGHHERQAPSAHETAHKLGIPRHSGDRSAPQTVVNAERCISAPA